jgi:hypothetical protein
MFPVFSDNIMVENNGRATMVDNTPSLPPKPDSELKRDGLKERLKSVSREVRFGLGLGVLEGMLWTTKVMNLNPKFKGGKKVEEIPIKVS